MKLFCNKMGTQKGHPQILVAFGSNKEINLINNVNVSAHFQESSILL